MVDYFTNNLSSLQSPTTPI